MTTPYTDNTLHQTLEEMEAALLAPLVSGELKSWTKGVRRAASTFATDWTRCVCSDLQPKYKQIAGTEPDLLCRVEQMLETDKQLFEEMARFQEQLNQVEQLADLAGANEVRVEQQRKELENEGLHLILQVKKQQANVATWLEEAFYRDQGVSG